MKKIILTAGLVSGALTLGFAGSSFAATNATPPASSTSQQLSAHGPYIGGQIGYVDPHNNQTTDMWADMILPFFAHAGSRAYAGYRINDYFSFEAGYNWLVDKSETVGSQNRNAKIRGYDAVGKAYVPLKYGLSFYVKAGVADIHQNIKNTNPNYDSNTKKLMPVGGLGFGYNFNKSIALNISETRYFKSGDIHKIDFVSLGATITIPLKW